MACQRVVGRKCIESYPTSKRIALNIQRGLFFGSLRLVLPEDQGQQHLVIRFERTLNAPMHFCGQGRTLPPSVQGKGGCDQENEYDGEDRTHTCIGHRLGRTGTITCVTVAIRAISHIMPAVCRVLTTGDCHQIVLTTFARRISWSAVTKSIPSTSAVAPITRSAGSFG
jgi:hypothetical protein